MKNEPSVEKTRALIVAAANELVNAKQQYAKGDADNSAVIDEAQEQYEELILNVAAEEMLLLLKK
ncbi:hypothetical protein [Serratia marcescens]|jgi:ABC-type branched-subunit amino acid transport system substrate-binding protein|uniref:hypothetical protein n=1 Tax=Serratia marcescens TaxID=615 RepID=UPI001E2B4584|nr:hypothetical protein [Serratia marcescens]